MKRRTIFILMLLLASLGLHAQPRGRAGERIHAIKIGYLTDRLKLTPQQAASFWPVYDRYEADIRDAKRSFRQKYRGGAAADDAEANQYIEDQLDYQQQLLAINRKYKDQMLEIISPQQLAALYEAERDFRKLLLQQLRERRRR